MSTRVEAVILTLGHRPEELERCLESIRAQTCAVATTLVLNGAGNAGDHNVDNLIDLPENLGVAGGRNAGIDVSTADLILFLDDDAWLSGPGNVAAAVERFDADESIGVVGFRVVDPATGLSLRRWLPRLRKSNLSPGFVAGFPGGACVIRRAMLDQVGAFPEHFQYSGEETDLAWRAIDRGWTIWFAGDQSVFHPSTPATRHDRAWYLICRNRGTLALTHLPIVIAPIYMIAGVIRALLAGHLKEGLRGTMDAMRQRTTSRQPMSWGTFLNLWRLGRPPIV